MNRKTTQKKSYQQRGIRLLISLYLIAVALSAQTTEKVAFTYDEAGNRKSRQIVVLSNSQNQASADFARPTETDLGNQKIIIYPNPTKGVLGVEVRGGNPKDQVKVMTFSMQGILVNTEKGSGGSLTRIDLSPFPVGQYIMRVIIGGKNTEYKIIKE